MKEKILIIDDEKMILDHLSMLLTSEGFFVRSASDGQAAIDIFKSEPFDLVITDMRMPGMDGLEVAKQIRYLHKDTEIIILTGFFTSDNVVKALRNGVSYFLSKPLENIDELLIPVKTSLKKRRLCMKSKVSTYSAENFSRQMMKLADNRRCY